MLERSIFMQALDCHTAAERSALLDQACAHDPALRQRVEALLRSDESAGSFLSQSVPKRLAQQLELPPAADETQPPQPDQDDDGRSLEFLAPSDSPGSLGKLGHYEVQEVIGRGGMGIVLRAFDERLHRVVAIKVMAAQLATSAMARKRFIREARAAAAISHDHIVTIHAVEEVSGLPYIAMHYVAGQSLQQRLYQNGPLELSEILRIGMQTAAGLAAAHAQGLIHRDIKPANILLENGVERVKITDFGLARAAADASLTQTGTTAGTPEYMAPEQARGEALDARTDLFGLGSVLYAMCTGRSPFRGSNTLAVLKRVCEETPDPIRETNPAIPDFLVAIVARLQAKNPAERYQSAAEVAEVLNGHLAQHQQPSAAGQAPVPVEKSRRDATPRSRRLLWAAAAALLCAALLLGLAEAGGVTKLTTSVIRVLTPQGTLIIEVDDPGVKVTVEGDGGLVITGAGPREVRLPAGKYTVRATKDGQPVQKEEVVSIIRGGEQTVRVLREPPAATAQVAGSAAAPFVLLGGTDAGDRKFDSLAEAVLTASDGDTIEIRGNGPFITHPISINDRALVIRAGAGFWPVIKADPDEPGDVLLNSNSRLVLAGLDLRWVEARPFDPSDARYLRLVVSSGPAARLDAVNCRFLMNRREGPHEMTCIWAALCHLRNCQLLVGGHGTLQLVCDIWGNPHSTATVDNCLTIGWGMQSNLAHAEPTKLVLNHNTILGPNFINFYLVNKSDPPGGEQDSRPFQIVASANIFAGRLQFVQSPEFLEKEKILSAQDAERLLTQLVGWQDDRNLYSSPEDSDLLGLFATRKLAPPTAIAPTKRITTLPAWKNFWGLEELDSQRGGAKFQGGDLVAKAKSRPELVVPEDFRLRPDSPGYRAGKDGQNLGADVDLVGPGAAYERWKKTPEYKQWVKDTGQLR